MPRRCPMPSSSWVAHETYPGHHTEHAWKEQLLTRNGRLEETIVLIPTPQSVVSEGIATLAAEITLGAERHEFTASAVDGIGVRYDPELSRAVMEAYEPFSGVATNAALKLHVDGGLGRRGSRVRHALGAGVREAGRARDRLHQRPDVALVHHDVPERPQAVQEVRRGRRSGRFKRLLTEQLTPADLR